MNKEQCSNRIELDLRKVDSSKMNRIGCKVIDLLTRKIKNPTHAYLLLKALCYFFEDRMGFRLDPEEERKLRRTLTEESEEYEV